MLKCVHLGPGKKEKKAPSEIPATNPIFLYFSGKPVKLFTVPNGSLFCAKDLGLSLIKTQACRTSKDAQ